MIDSRRMLTLDELRQTIEFKQLTPQMSAWVETYVTNYFTTGKLDPAAASMAVYKCKSVDDARRSGRRLKCHPAVGIVLDLFFGYTPEEVLKRVVTQTAIYHRKITVAQMKAINLYAKLHGVAVDFEEEVEEVVAKTKKPAGASAKKENPQVPPPESRVPPGARPLYDMKSGVLNGYRTVEGEFVKLAEVKAEIRS